MLIQIYKRYLKLNDVFFIKITRESSIQRKINTFPKATYKYIRTFYTFFQNFFNKQLPPFLFDLVLEIYNNLNFDEWPKDQLDNKYFWENQNSNYTKPISYKTVYEKNRRYYEKAGIPSKLLALSSFRSGFYCQAYLNSINNRISIEVLNELTMLIAGWRDLKTQKVYIKNQLDPLLTSKGRGIRPTPA